MFTNFTWWQFIGAFLLFSIIYYPLILWLYFKNEIQRLFKPAFINDSTGDNTISENKAEKTATTTTAIEPLSNEELAASVYNLQTDITNGVKAAKDAGVSKEQLMGLLQNMLLKYPELKHSTHRVQINDFMVQECTKAAYVVQLFEVYALWATTAQPNN